VDPGVKHPIVAKVASDVLVKVVDTHAISLNWL
jgi:hypothetical protein